MSGLTPRIPLNTRQCEPEVVLASVHVYEVPMVHPWTSLGGCRYSFLCQCRYTSISKVHVVYHVLSRQPLAPSIYSLCCCDECMHWQEFANAHQPAIRKHSFVTVDTHKAVVSANQSLYRQHCVVTHCITLPLTMPYSSL
jgi:hypothetical protein